MALTQSNLLAAGATSPRFWCECWKPLVVHPVRGEIIFQPYEYQARLMAALARPQQVRVNKARQIGISTAAMVEAVRECVEFGPLTFVAGSRKEEVAKELLQIATLAAKTHCRPNSPPLTRTATQELRWSNGSRIVAETASPEMARSYAASVFILDEAAYLPDQEAIWASMRPTVSRTSRVWIVSTPAGEGDAFHRMWEDESFSGPRFQLPWRECPEYDEAWYVRERPQYTQEQWAREFECSFEGSGNVPFRPEVIRRCMELGEVLFRAADDDPRARKGWHIITGVDPAGEGEDESVAIDLDTTTRPWLLVDGESWQSVPAPVLQAGIEDHRDRHQSRLVIENNGLGWAVAQNLLVPANTITTTSGRGSRMEKGNWSVAKTVLLNALIVAMENGNVAIPMDLTDDGRPVFAELRKQLSSYRWNDKGLRTDWVMALADAIWIASSQGDGNITVFSSSDGDRPLRETIGEQLERLSRGAAPGGLEEKDILLPGYENEPAGIQVVGYGNPLKGHTWEEHQNLRAGGEPVT